VLAYCFLHYSIACSSNKLTLGKERKVLV